jgi:hypothetical protein
MSLLDGDEGPAAGRRDLPVGLDYRTIRLGLDDARGQVQQRVEGRGALQDDVEVRRDRARRARFAGLTHQVVRRGPVAVAVQDRPADSAVHDALEREVVRLRPPVRHDRFALHEALDLQALRVGRPASEAAVLRRVGVLEAVRADQPIALEQPMDKKRAEDDT